MKSKKIVNLLAWILSAWFLSATMGCGDGFRSRFSSLNGFGSNTVPCCSSNPNGSSRTSLLDNSGFEQSLTGWEDWGNSSIQSGQAHSGSSALHIAAGIGGRGQEVIYRLKTGGKYALKAFAKVSSPSDQVYLGIKFTDTSNVVLSEPKVRVLAQAYAEYDLEFTVPLSVSSAKIYIYKQNQSAGTVDADDFSLTQVGSPVDAPKEPAIANPANYQPIGLGSNWQLVMNDDFTAASLNSSLWNSGFWFTYTLNNELQAYRSENLRQSGGILSLLAEQRSTQTTWGDPMNYASAAITTRNTFSFTFGVVEARLKVPKGKGFYPQFWLLPWNKRAPPEIDVLQVNGADTSTAHFNYAWIDDGGIARGQAMVAARGDLSADYHIYTLDWRTDSISYYIDGVLVGRYAGDFVLRDPAYLILNLAVGGDTAGAPNAGTVFPQSMDVDYIRVFQ